MIEKARLKPKNSPLKKDSKAVKPDDKVPDKQAGGVEQVKPDKEWRPGGKGKKIELSKPVRATRTLKKRQYADNSTEDEESEMETETELQPDVPAGSKTYKELYVDHIIHKPTETSKPFLALLQAVACENASEFELPKAINLPEQFPYSWKWSTDEKRRKLEDENGHIMCYVCVKTSRVGPLVTCDYCPLSFHLDCLDPPMSEIPRDVWMCPNHVETYLDTRLATTRVTERVELWDRYARQPLDTNSVKLQFMKRCQREKRNDKFYNRKKVPLNQKNKVSVPGYVQSYYHHPPSLLPTTDHERWHRPGTHGVNNREDSEMEWVAGLVSLQTDLLRNISNKDKSVESDIGGVKDESEEADLKCNESLDAKSEDEEEEKAVSPASTLSTCSLSPRHKHQLSSVQTSGSGGGNGSLVTMLSEYLATHRRDVEGMDPVVVQYLAARQLQSLLGHNNNTAGDRESTVRARACLTPLHSRKTPVAMRYRTLTIGTGANTGLDLSQYGHCNNVSSKHASIFYDELSDCYELLNYSPHGTRVDEVVYGLDLDMVRGRYSGKADTHGQGEGVTMSAGASSDSGPCYCRQAGQPRSGCESSALVKHGSLLQFGCLQFVFSIAELGSELDM